MTRRGWWCLPCGLKHQGGYSQHLGPSSIRVWLRRQRREYWEDTSHRVYCTRSIVPTQSTVLGENISAPPRYQEHSSHPVHCTRRTLSRYQNTSHSVCLSNCLVESEIVNQQIKKGKETGHHLRRYGSISIVASRMEPLSQPGSGSGVW